MCLYLPALWGQLLLNFYTNYTFIFLPWAKTSQLQCSSCPIYEQCLRHYVNALFGFMNRLCLFKLMLVEAHLWTWKHYVYGCLMLNMLKGETIAPNAAAFWIFNAIIRLLFLCFIEWCDMHVLLLLHFGEGLYRASKSEEVEVSLKLEGEHWVAERQNNLHIKIRSKA